MKARVFGFFYFISLKSCVVSCFCSVAPVREETDVTCRLNVIYFFKELVHLYRQLDHGSAGRSEQITPIKMAWRNEGVG